MGSIARRCVILAQHRHATVGKSLRDTPQSISVKHPVNCAASGKPLALAVARVSALEMHAIRCYGSRSRKRLSNR